MNADSLTKLLGVVFLCMSITAQADIKIQSAQFKEKKSAVYVKGKTSDDSLARVYVVNSESNVLLGTIDVKKGHFKSDVPVTAFNTPCMIQVQTNRPGGGWFGRNNSSPGEFQVSTVRNAPDRCKQ